MKTFTTTARILTQDQLVARWAAKAPTRQKHFARRVIFYAREILKMVAVFATAYALVYLKYS